MSNKTDLSLLHNYAFYGQSEGLDKMLRYLTSIAEEEIWSFDDSKPYTLLKKYIMGTFSQCYKQGKVIEDINQQYSCFNTGLMTPNGNDIIALFEKNTRAKMQPWVLKGFKDICDRGFMDIFSEIPPLASYTENYEEFYFNPDWNIVINADHILDDNWDRIEAIVHMKKNVVKTLLFGVIEEAKRRIKRNIRLVVPQYYRGEIMYLVPIRIPKDDGEYETMALAVERTSSSQYRANTIFTKEMAYEKARLLMKPESNWLIEK